MIKKIKLKNRDVPVPVPLKTLSEAVSWVEETFSNKGGVLTLIKLNGKHYDIESGEWAESLLLNEDSDLEFQVDTPKELGVQSLDAVRDLSYSIMNTLKYLAVECWEDQSAKQAKKLTDIEGDLELILSLIDHLNGIFDYTTADMAPVNGLGCLIRRSLEKMKTFRQEDDFKNVAKILLNRLEPLLKEMVSESEVLQITALTLPIAMQGEFNTPSL
jgi:hypothetical protein